MAEWDSADLLARLKTELKRPTNSAEIDDDVLYRDLTEGLRYMAAMLFSHGIESNAVWEQATTSDNKTYTITTEPDATPIVRDGREGAPLTLGLDGALGADLVWQGTTFLVPDNREREFSNGLQVRYSPQHVAISAIVAPTLKPERARLGAVYKAAELFLDRGGHRDIGWIHNKIHRVLFGDPTMPGDVGLIGARKQGFPGPQRGGYYWWRHGGAFTR